MSTHLDKAILKDIFGAATQILALADGMEKSEFVSDIRTNLAVQHQIIVIGEATKRLSVGERNAMQEIPWSGIARMRDRLVHGYDSVDMDIVWDTVTKDIPVLLQTVRTRIDSAHGS